MYRNINTISHPLVWGFALLFVINQFIERCLGIFIPYVHAYLDDVLCMPVVLGIAMQVIQWIHPLKQQYYLSVWHLMWALIYFSILFELVLPCFSPLYTADWLDVFCYAAGTLLYYAMIIHPLRQKQAV